MKKVVIVDSVPFMRVALRHLLVKNGFIVIGEAKDKSSALELCLNLKPDIITMDLSIVKNEELDIIANIKEMAPVSKIVMVSAMGDEKSLKNVMNSGVHALIKKPYIENNVLQVLNKL